MSHTLAEVAEQTGKSAAILRKHIERGKLKASKDGPRVVIEDDDLDAYLASDIFEEAATHVSSGGIEVGSIFARLPPRFVTAILDGMGTPKQWQDATAGMAPGPSYPMNTDDPHYGFAVGYRHEVSPRWSRVDAKTWKLGNVTYTWDGSSWQGGGDRDGALRQGISPAHPDTFFRPLGPGNVVR